MNSQRAISQTSKPRQQSLEALLTRTERSEGREGLSLDSSAPIDRSRLFVCPTLTPLYYTRVYADLTEDQQRRYNQLCAMGFSELIAFFESTFASSVLLALAHIDDGELSEAWQSCLRQFLDDEREHIRWWHELNQLSDPQLYATGVHQIIRVSPILHRLLKFFTGRPRLFPVVFWIMIALEERSLDISRRCLKMDRELIEPRYRLIYQQHLKDESRHVQMDWHLIERFFANRSKLVQGINARLFCFMIGRFFLRPNRSAIFVVRRLVAEHAELAPLLPEMTRQLKRLHQNPEYQEMMYSRSTTPITFSLFDRFDVMHRVQQVLQSYQPLLDRPIDATN
jgi:hypothetical protein